MGVAILNEYWKIPADTDKGYIVIPVFKTEQPLPTGGTVTLHSDGVNATTFPIASYRKRLNGQYVSSQMTYRRYWLFEENSFQWLPPDPNYTTGANLHYYGGLGSIQMRMTYNSGSHKNYYVPFDSGTGNIQNAFEYVGIREDNTMQDNDVWTSGFCILTDDDGNFSFVYVTGGITLAVIKENPVGLDCGYADFVFSNATISNSTMGNLWNWGNPEDGKDIINDNHEHYEENEDPYAPEGESAPGGGDGSFSRPSTPVPVPGLPSLDITDTGVCTLYAPGAPAMTNIVNYLWSSAFDTSNIKKMMADPMECIVGFLAIPCTVATAGTKEMTMGGVSLGFQVAVCANQYIEISCGSVALSRYFGSYLDYDPFTSVEIFLPYIGFRTLKCNNVMNATITLTYHIDVLTGGCLAYLVVSDISSVIYTFEGNCGVQLPVWNRDWGNLYASLLNVAVPAMATTVGGVVGGGGVLKSIGKGALEVGTQTVDEAQSAVNQNKLKVERSGSMSGTVGLMGCQTPYLLIEQPAACVAANENRYTGYPSHIEGKLNSFGGFTVVSEIRFVNVPATEEELSELEGILKGGVIL